MEIGYNEYPSVLYTSFQKEDAPQELPFEVVNEKTHNYLSQCTGFREMFALIAVKNTLNKGNACVYFYLEDNLFGKIDGYDYFRNSQFRNFFSSYVKPKCGAILFHDSGQYVYMLLGKQETKKLKNRNGRYIAVALFKKNVFIGFEEGIILDEGGVDVFPTGEYASGMDRGGFISFVLITLAYAGDGPHTVMDTKLKETVYKLV